MYERRIFEIECTAHICFFLVVSRFDPYSNKTILYDLRLAADIIVIHLNVFLSQIANFLCNVRLKPLFLHWPQNTVHAHKVFRFHFFTLFFFLIHFYAKYAIEQLQLQISCVKIKFDFFFFQKLNSVKNLFIHFDFCYPMIFLWLENFDWSKRVSF